MQQSYSVAECRWSIGLYAANRCGRANGLKSRAAHANDARGVNVGNVKLLITTPTTASSTSVCDDALIGRSSQTESGALQERFLHFKAASNASDADYCYRYSCLSVTRLHSASVFEVNNRVIVLDNKARGGGTWCSLCQITLASFCLPVLFCFHLFLTSCAFSVSWAHVAHPSTSAALSDYWWWSGVKEGTLTQLL